VKALHPLAHSIFMFLVLHATYAKSIRPEGLKLGTPLDPLGAKMEAGVGLQEIEGYSRFFNFTDKDNDGKHSKVEYVDNGNYLNPQARAGIFNASDNDRDGSVSRAEYILNRIITDEAKTIVQAMDVNKNGTVDRTEFINQSMPDKKLAAQVFIDLDTDRNGILHIPEYLKVWGMWARYDRQSAEKRISARKAELEKSGQAIPSSRPTDLTGRPGGPPFGRPGLADHLMRYDVDKNGKIELEELSGLIRDADRNKDGALDREELNAIRTPSSNHKRSLRQQ
jgi:Ca2+-binding EF-hand superfamily protein